MRSQSYWENRKARELYEQLVDAEETAEQLRKLYMRSSKEIEEKAQQILKRFQLKHNLTETEARRLLRRTGNIDDLIRLLQQDPKNAELIAELEAPAYAARLKRLEATQASVDLVTRRLYSEVQPGLTDLFERIGRRAYYHQIFDMQQRSGAAFPFGLIDDKRLRQVIDTPWSGKNFSQRLWDNTEQLAAAVKEQILLGILTGKTQKQMADVISGRFSAGSNATRRLVRTEANYVANQMQLESYREHGVEKYIYVAILDLRTSLICRELDKKAFRIEEAVPGFNYPPMHPWCRSTTIAWMPAQLLRKLEQAAIDPETGETVHIPGDMTYNEWYRKYVTDRSVKDYLVSGSSDPALVTEQQAFDTAIQKSTSKVQQATAGTAVELGTRPASGYDMKADKIYLAEGTTEADAHHEIGHVVDTKLIDHAALDMLKKERYKNTTVWDLKTATRHLNDGTPVDILVIEDPRFVSEYQGRVYCKERTQAFDDDGYLKTELLEEYISEPYRVYMEDPAILKAKDPEVFSIIEQGIL